MKKQSLGCSNIALALQAINFYFFERRPNCHFFDRTGTSLTELKKNSLITAPRLSHCLPIRNILSQPQLKKEYNLLLRTFINWHLFKSCLPAAVDVGEL